MASNEQAAVPPPPVGFKMGFKINKSLQPKSVILPSKLAASDALGDNDGIDFVTSIDNNQIKGTKPQGPAKSKELVIPLIAVNKYKIIKKTTNEDKTASSDPTNAASAAADDLTSKAKQDLLQEARRFNEEENGDAAIPAWKLMIINKVPDEYENDSKLDVSIRPETPSLDDYENIPIEGFGSALLRGMGWKNGDPIGGINKAVTPIFEPQLRARGLGLGADVSLQKQLQNGKDGSKSDEALIRKGAYVCVEAGSCRGYYGTVESISDDLSHVSVKLYLSRETVDLPQAVLRIVSKKEFEEEGRIINKSKYDDYNAQSSSGNNSQTETNELFPPRQRTHREEECWVMPNIRAEIRDREYKNGKYYKDKVVILETKADKCICRTKDGRELKDISQSMLRTVIPRKSDLVMVVRGEYKGKLAKLEHVGRRDATIQLVGIISKPVTLSLNDICESYTRS